MERSASGFNSISPSFSNNPFNFRESCSVHWAWQYPMDNKEANDRETNFLMFSFFSTDFISLFVKH